MPIQHQYYRAFSLVELLIVVAIVAILMSLVTPSLNKARNKAIQIQCLAIERTYAMTFFSYNSDNKNLYPYANRAQFPIVPGSYGVFGSVGLLWTQALSGHYPNSVPDSYSTAASVNPKVAARLRCPANPWVYSGNGGGNWAAATYGINSFVDAQAPFPYNYGVSGAGNDPAIYPGKLVRQARHDNLRRPSSLALMAEIPSVNNVVTPQMPWAGNNFGAVFLDSSSFTSGSTANNTWRVSINTYGAGAAEMAAYARVNHDLGWNVLHADSSATYYSKTQMQALSLSANAGAFAAFWKDN